MLYIALTMKTRIFGDRSVCLRIVLGLAFVLGLGQCGGEPLIVLDIDPKTLATVTALQLRLQLNEDAVQEQQPTISERGIVVHLPEGASGTVKIDLVGWNAGGCKVALAKLQEDVPGGLSRSTRRTVDVKIPAVPLCPHDLRAVLSMGDTSAVVVGDGGTILHCTGDTCSALPTGITTNLAAVWKSDATTFYAVGNAGTVLRCSTALRTCSALPAAVEDDLYRVWGDGQHVYAVGNAGAVLQCDLAAMATGSMCKRAIPATASRIFGLWGNSGNLYLAGTDGQIQRCALDKSGITSCSTITTGTTDPPLYWAWGFESFLYAVGASARVVRCEGLACSTLYTGPPKLNAIWGLSASNVYAVGNGGVVLRCVQQSCGMLPRVTDKFLLGVWGDASDVYAVGDGGTVLRCAVGSSSCTPLSSHTTQSLLAVAGSEGNNVYAVGAGGTVVKCAAGGCMALTTDPGE